MEEHMGAPNALRQHIADPRRDESQHQGAEQQRHPQVVDFDPYVSRPQLVQKGRQIHSGELCAHPDGACDLRQPCERVADEYRRNQDRKVQAQQRAKYDARHKMHR